MTDSTEELKLLSAMAYAEASSKNVYEEMAGIASVLVRQRDARGYSTIQEFTAQESTYSFVVKDGNPRFSEFNKIDIDGIENEINISNSELTQARADLEEVKKLPVGSTQKEKEAAKKTISDAEKSVKSKELKYKKLLGFKSAIDAAKNALSGGADFSNGGYFWDGADIKTNYAKHFKVKHGIKIMDPAHNIYGIKDSIKLIIKTKIIVTKKKSSKKETKLAIEVGRYDHVYESTAGQGGTIFWKHNPEYMRVQGAFEYK